MDSFVSTVESIVEHVLNYGSVIGLVGLLITIVGYAVQTFL
ncbi:hypothetical protein [Corynebacterium deserti]|nr:hypothetical protein [Corynebacterium deserti]